MPSIGNEGVPTFEELDTAHGRIEIYVDAKDLTPAALVHALEMHDMRMNVVVYGPPAFLKAVLSLRPEINVMPEADEMNTITSPQALADPFDPHLTLESSFLKLPNLEGVITDSHFSQRDRFGRLLAFLAHIAQNTGFYNSVAKRVGIDERKAVLLEPDGSATIAGEGAAYFVSANKKPGVCAAGKPLTFEDLSVHRIPAGGKFNFRSWTGQGGVSYRLSASSGILFSSKGTGSLY